MEQNSKSVLVIGATGNIGGSVARELINKDYSVRTITRNASGASALALKELGVEVLQGDLNDKQALDTAMSGMDAVFAVTTPFEEGPEIEVKHGLAMIDAAKSAGVEHFVFSSVSDADKGTGIPHFESKFKVEQYLAQSGLNYTISGPVFVIDNYLSPWFLPGIQTGEIKMAMPKDTNLQVISFAEIGSFGAAIIERGSAVYGKRFDIASDKLTGDETAALFSAVTGTTVKYEGFDPEYMRADSADMADMFVWFNKVGYSADIEELQREFPEVAWQSAEEWVQSLDPMMFTPEVAAV